MSWDELCGWCCANLVLNDVIDWQVEFSVEQGDKGPNPVNITNRQLPSVPKHPEPTGLRVFVVSV